MRFNQFKFRQQVQRLMQRGHQGWTKAQSFLWDLTLDAAARAERAIAPMRRSVAADDLTRLRQDLLDESRLSWHYLVLVVGACIIATLGLLSNSAAVIIGAMLIAPLMLPIRGAAFGILEADRPLIRASILALAVGSFLSVIIAALLGAVTGVAQFGSEVMARTQPTLLDLGIAITAGALAGVAKIEPKVAGTVAGTAIAVALMPPICVVGLWLGRGNLELSLGALLLYLTNLFGITLACMVAFVVFGYSMARRARRPLSITLLFTTLLVIPLGATTLRLFQQNQLEASVERALLDRTLTFQRVTLVDMDANWLTKPPEISLTVRSSESISPNQVELLEQFLARELGRAYRLTFLVNQLDVITSDPNSKDADP
ncbi:MULTISPECIES: TIGR00341 family protein [Cyanophyceae]|uniref:TIGR00341 family protein n=1 Tax=Cyanophyceae TaxID=3028117 RepID=UPI00168697D6|nr:MULTISPECIES: TIGR00341 family protein [Cyanophyceae]MBD1915135.1 TIGR00341 family protein [Phormidium sp. FACHB-77]MBD2032021.1 TIGR00341 family protein [Phormidium sp. FACHB-322]MBD2050495.1 TIGR00341 family protein [Leptolyngbya sp. FACHB-60]